MSEPLDPDELASAIVDGESPRHTTPPEVLAAVDELSDAVASLRHAARIDGTDEVTRQRHLRSALEEYDRVAAAAPVEAHGVVSVLRAPRWPRLPLVAAAAVVVLVVGLSMRFTMDGNSTADNTASAPVRDDHDRSKADQHGSTTMDSARSYDKADAAPSATGPASDQARVGAPVVDLGAFGDESSLRSSALAATTTPIASSATGSTDEAAGMPLPSTPTMLPSPSAPPAPPAMAPQARQASSDEPCAEVPLTQGTELRRFRAVLRSEPVIVVVAETAGSTEPVVGVLRAPACDLIAL